MTNEERRAALATARNEAFGWAENAQDAQSVYGDDTDTLRNMIQMATMWASVAQALKTGDAHADTPDH